MSSHGPVFAMAAVGASYLILAIALPSWWTHTDYCPDDPTTFCSGLPPLMIAFMLTLPLVAAGYGAYAGREDD